MDNYNAQQAKKKREEEERKKRESQQGPVSVLRANQPKYVRWPQLSGAWRAPLLWCMK